MDESPGESSEDVRSPCVRAVVRNFEQRDSSTAGESDVRHPVVTKSKVAQLRENLGNASDSVGRVESNDVSSNDLRKRGDNCDANSDSEYTVSVSRLKESLKKSAGNKHVVPWGFGGTGRSVREPKNSLQNSNSDGEIIEDRTHGEDRSKRKINNSFKMAKSNLLDPFTKLEKSRRNPSSDVDVIRDNSGKCDSLPSILSRSNVDLSRSYSRDEDGESRAVPKVLPKPAVRKSKTSSTKTRPVVTGNEREKTYRPKPRSRNKGADSGTVGTSSSEKGHPVHETISAVSTVSDEVNNTSDQSCAEEHLLRSHDVDRHDRMMTIECDDDCTRPKDSLPVRKCDSQENDFNPSTGEITNDTNICRSGEDDSTSQSNQSYQHRNQTSIKSSETTADVITSDDDAKVNRDQHLNYETATTSGDNVVAGSPMDNSVTGSEPVCVLPESSGGPAESNRRDSNPLDGTHSNDETIFLDCMGSDFLSEVEELCSVTNEELEYNALSEIACSTVLEKEDDFVKRQLLPFENYHLALDHVIDLFKDEIFLNIEMKKTGVPLVDESSFLSCDSLREVLLDKATKKFERLAHLKQKLDVLITKHYQLETQLQSVVKKKIETKYFCKYCSVIEDLDKVAHLLLMLSSRLANTDLALNQISLSDDEQQKAHLIAKRENFTLKYEEAVLLKETIDNRRHRLTAHLKQQLSPNEFSDYQNFIKTKCQLKVIKQSIEDRLTLSDEQKKVLVDVIESKTSARYC